MSDTTVTATTASAAARATTRAAATAGSAPPSASVLDSAAELSEFADQIADQIESFLVVVRAVARGDAPDSAVPMLLLEVSQLLLAGGRLGAVQDVVPEERFEEDPGPDPDLDELREKLAELLKPCDNYREVFDPLATQPELEARRISDDIASAVSDLAHGLTHYRAGRTLEALWWWQFSYLNAWGPAASAAVRALQSIIARSRLQE
ncbi:MAG TPA: DUF5063 domain-containing protein [Actinocrinis sp.]|jgi:hypothetical protein|uniref:DUF5063 domain-containing protein n=1 Tax=Actinocrinis sp. TaxID=1920516 RepID=UPI002DDD3203|nr:DUF5063 domain-containing protein [Actinocrinis sp.]HEV3172262.1 DUF5063 domain-containing protein [Actinocrinis sp.]